MRAKPLFAVLLFVCTGAVAQKTYQLQSPDGRLSATINVGKTITWSVKDGYTEVITPSTIGMELAGGEVLGQNVSVKKAETSKADEMIKTPFYKKTNVNNHYNQITLSFKGDYGVIFRAYDDGLAYRFVSERKGEITINNEQAQFNFKNDDTAYLPFVNDYRNKDKFTTSFEALYSKLQLSAIPKDSLAILPLLVDLGNQQKAAILEADIEDYPGMYLAAGDKGSNGLTGTFAKYPTVEANGGHHNINYVVNGRADYIAKITGPKMFPWRIVIISNSDKELLDNDMMQKIAAPSRVADISWIKPGKVAWDWWNNWNISHVNFKAGINNDTYKYYIDFAAANKLEYVVIDEGWSDDVDLTKISPAINLKELIDYGKQKNVGVILWASWFAITRDLEGILTKYEQMGVKGFKIDFIDRDDQKMTKSLYAIADAAAKHHMMVDYHGMYKPSGIQHTYPNLINFEGVKGMENVKWGVKDHPVYDVSIPFIRMLAGPMDYTPGAMRNANKANWRAVNDNPMSQGTRCHQLAMYTIFEAPLQMLADNPTSYMKEQESTDFIAAVPTTFDETVALDGSVGNYVAIARRKGTTWFAGAMTSWDARSISIDLSFLGDGKYRAVIFEDGINADNDATDYKKSTVTVNAKDKLNIKMAPGGGWSARFEKI
ncbi:glycoside hydrolase family 97 protein [Mucilaginibacter polytrichastri]|uniref:Retaining alpha-galactosidase n=1 Tax=Mucilaginibacter polytrichastri TaxID=1302689 RepID=A0A1Q6A5Q4_9SPHI|nr:glycoside hydrolase family 97 protein [Mucilaginibacter polytrichastri]OKS89341.1 Retaining alpha-galactosidase [Mucilaginibacter polytrichastri]SFS74265.1 alpha-glucosidase [Mucilaginibacter polytrichastri]